jgi:hypothetical protein
MSLGAFLTRHLPWRYARLYYSAARPVRRLVHRLRYRPMPPGGWGKGWRVLVFRYAHQPRRQLHVLAPVDGDQFDWEVLRLHVRGAPWPAHAQEAGQLTGVMGWAGHHTCVVTDEYGPQRLSTGRLVPGEFRGGVDVGLVLIDVREARLEAADPA